MRKHYVVLLEKKDRAKCRTWQLRVDSGTIQVRSFKNSNGPRIVPVTPTLAVANNVFKDVLKGMWP